MNEQVKMSDVFTDTNGVCASVKLSCLYDFYNDGVTPFDMIDKAVTEYDQHVDLISKQAEQINIMRDCIAEIRNGGLLLSEIESMCDKVINHTKLASDKLTQAEPIKILREALKRTLITGVEFINSYDVDDEEDKATIETNFNNSLISAENALSATEQK